jgi:GMP synthase (glutamine-hydrolysing)
VARKAHVLVFRHVPFEHLGLIAPALESRGIEYEYLDLFRDAGREIPLGSAAGLISMGGPMSANDDFPYLHRELVALQQAIHAGKPVLGVCLGSQMIAKALGANVFRNKVKEIGWAPLYWTEAAAADALFSGFSEPETVLHWHGETFDLPSGAAWLARSEACRNQAFRWGSAVYGLQFHLEVTPEMIAAWSAEDANAGDMRELSTPIDPDHNAARLAKLAEIVFGRWASLVTS